VLEHSGHWPFVDDPVTVAGALRAFLDRQPQAAATPEVAAA
jgi:pimeloyl-ACP methyl ester carboxylesterase